MTEFKQVLQQKMHLSPQQLQSMKLLQMDILSLNEYLDALALENPTFEKESPPSEEFQSLRSAASWLDTSSSSSNSSGEPSIWDEETESLSTVLGEQLERKHLPPSLLALCQYLIGLLTPNGYLEREDIQATMKLGIPSDLMRQAVNILQSLDPPGIAAEDLRECLLLQLQRQEKQDLLAQKIVKDFLTSLGNKQYSLIAKELGITEQQVLDAEKRILKLDPRPGASFYEQHKKPEYICPDIFIVEVEGELKPVLNHFYLPRVSVSDYYLRMMEESQEKETKEYLSKKIQQAQWVVDALSRRYNTLEKCAYSILNLQYDFFKGGSTMLSPMTLRTVASVMDVHESTVSRCISGKYLQCKQGIYPLKYFFSRSLNFEQSDISLQAAKIKLLHLIEKEDPAHPFSDQQLSKKLADDGILLARRTVAKYRSLLNIPSASGRKR